MAELAELPGVVIDRAQHLLEEFEGDQTETTSGQLSLFEPEQVKETPAKRESTSYLEDELKRMELMEMTPLEAMNELHRLQKAVKR